MVKTHLKRTVQSFSLDNFLNLGGSHSCQQFFNEHEILHQTSIPHTSQQNGVIERKYKHLLKCSNPSYSSPIFLKNIRVNVSYLLPILLTNYIPLFYIIFLLLISYMIILPHITTSNSLAVFVLLLFPNLGKIYFNPGLFQLFF